MLRRTITVLPVLMIVPTLVGCATSLTWENERSDDAASPKLVGVLAPSPAEGRHERQLVIRYTTGDNSIVGTDYLYATVPLLPDGQAPAPFGYAGKERTNEAIAADFPGERYREIQNTRLPLVWGRDAKRILDSASFEPAGVPGARYWTRRGFRGSGFAMIAFGAAKPGERVVEQKDVDSFGPQTFPADSVIVALPGRQDRPEAFQKARLDRTSLVTPALLAFDALAWVVVIPLMLLGVPLGH
jgi:hypothetical protein